LPTKHKGRLRVWEEMVVARRRDIMIHAENIAGSQYGMQGMKSGLYRIVFEDGCCFRRRGCGKVKLESVAMLVSREQEKFPVGNFVHR
jgi:hypothetical protein